MSRLGLILLTGALILLGVPTHGQGVCGDVTGDGMVDIADLVYLIDYIFQQGPEPISLVDADMDGCEGVDIADLGYLIAFLFGYGPPPCMGSSDCAIHPGGSISVDFVEGALGSGTVMTNTEITFHLRVTNDTEHWFYAFSNGVRVYSPDGAQWGTTTADTTGGLSVLQGSLMFNVYNPTGSGADTVALGAVIVPGMNDGLPPGFDDVVWTITVDPISPAYDGKTICIDSSYFAPAGLWKWSRDGFSSYGPSWSGPHCYEIIAPTLASVTIDPLTGTQGPNQIPTDRPVPFDLRFTNNTGDTIMAFMNGLKVYSPDGAQWGTTVGDSTGVLTSANFNAAFMINHFGVTGSGADSVVFGGAVIPFNDDYTGIPPGFDDVPFTITVGPIDSVYNGKTLCIDSAWTPPSGYWLWHSLTDEYEPAWYGPYCYTIYYEEIPPVLLSVTPDTLEFTVWEGGPNPGSRAFAVTEQYGRNIAYIADYIESTWMDLPSNSGVTPDELVVDVYSSQLGVGVYTNDVVVESFEAENGPQYVAVKLTVLPGPEAAVILDHVDGSWDANGIRTGIPVVFNMRLVNNTGHNMTGIVNGYRVFSINGAHWGNTVGAWAPAFDPMDYEIGAWINYFGVTGSGADTVGFAAAAAVKGLVNGFDDVLYTIEIGPIDTADIGKTVCLDSAYYPPSGIWKWAGPQINCYPEWFGPYCFTVVEGGGSEGDDSLLIPSTTVVTGNMVQPVQVKLTQPIKGASIPIAIPEAVTVSSLSAEGLLIESWDYSVFQIKPDSGFLYVALANSFGEVIPEGTHTVFNIHFSVLNADCDISTYVHWDIALQGDPVRGLLFADVNHYDLPVGFDPMRDATEIPPYMPCDIDYSGVIDIADLVYLVDYMFNGGPPPDIMDAADVNGSCSGPNIADLVFVVDFFFQQGPEPLCGCLAEGGGAGKIAPDIVVGAVFENGITTIAINSPYDLRGVQLEVCGSTDIVPRNLAADRLNLVYSSQDDLLRIGLLDLDGGEVIPAGRENLIQLDGRFEIVSAMVAQDGLTALGARIDNAMKPTSTPASFALHQNYPNPFNPVTQISFALPYAASVRLEVYNIMGQKVTTLLDETLQAGEHSAMWDGSTVASGVYFYRLDAGEFSETRKMMLLK